MSEGDLQPKPAAWAAGAQTSKAGGGSGLQERRNHSLSLYLGVLCDIHSFMESVARLFSKVLVH